MQFIGKRSALACAAVVTLMLSAGVSAEPPQIQELTVEIPVGDCSILNTPDGQDVLVEDYGRLLIPGKPRLPSRIFPIAIWPGAWYNREGKSDRRGKIVRQQEYGSYISGTCLRGGA